MRLSEPDALGRLAESSHGVLSTVNPERGVDAVPVVFAVDDGFVGIPVDLVKPKGSTRLQRERNLEHDPRAALLVENWDSEDWSRLWWVRASVEFDPEPGASRSAALARGLARRYEQYGDQPFARLIVLRIVGVTGWSGHAG
ncbi:pyridoxamine 5'-phosphate oxidase family protein [Dermatobacter hominis]|uniref:pyridoxamine 5'-phosphate oxidase family protein n=1 Tax=Dermatobacter hominis TaxID=2884263 RepID=UPI001D118E4F|nr:pyridoxamine 5'-phosphate oxidase family protein [Dermatobacter hominis]UDY34147.1 pyridoxamine 5'-phosphate oxidase family protein [Dermatobacter hominis]